MAAVCSGGRLGPATHLTRMVTLFSGLARRIRRALRPNRLDRQLQDELAFHVESETAAKVATGLSPADARRLTLAELGGVERWREEVRDQRPGGATELLLRDVRLALRGLRRAPSFSLPALGTLALGIAALVTIASLTSAILLQPLPYEDPGRLVALWERNQSRDRVRNVVSTTAFEAWRARSRTLELVTGFMPESDVWISDQGPERVFGARVSASMFALLGRQPAIGGGFSSDQAPAEVVISHGFWTRRLGGDSAVIGRAVRMSGELVTIVGVMPNDFVPLKFGWLSDQEFWRPLDLSGTHRWGRFLVVAGRMRDGATLETLTSDLAAITTQLHSEKALGDAWDSHAFVLSDEMTGSVRPALIALSIASLVLLAMVLTNTTLLMLAHLRQRAADRALRTALGATGSRLRRERLIVSAMIGGAGALLGAVLALGTIPLLISVLPDNVPRATGVHFDAFASAVVLAAAVLVTLVLALLPAGGRSNATSITLQSRRLTRRSRAPWLVTAEAALALVLAVFASLTVRSFDRLNSVDLGFDPNGLHAMRVSVATDSNTAPRVVFERLLNELRAIPGVTDAALTSRRPLGDGGIATTIAPQAAAESDHSTRPSADVRMVDPQYFAALALQPRSGRLFSGNERQDAPPVAIVNEAFVRTLWPDAPNAVGRKFQLALFNDIVPEIIGVVPDMRLIAPRQETRPTVYLSAAQYPDNVYDVLLRSDMAASALMPTVRRIVDRAVPGTPVYSVAPIADMLADAMSTERVTALLLGFFAVSALVLVAVGVYGVFAGDVARRRQELGVRMALGESAARVVRSMLTRTLALVVIGVVAGATISVFATRVLRSMLYGVPIGDIASHGAAIALVMITALGATLIPAITATRVDPVRALRAD